MTLSRKYELTDETNTVSGRTLYRIRALRDIDIWCVEAGDIGGFVESEANLSHEGDCWVGGYACVYEDAFVSEDACVCDDVYVSGSARVTGKAIIYGESRIYGHARVSGNARIWDNSYIGGGASISGNADISFYTEDTYDNIVIDMNISIDGDAEIADKRHVFYMGPVGRENWHFLAYRTKGGGACIKRSRSGFVFEDALEVVDENHDDWQLSDECRGLLDLIRDSTGNDHEIKGHDEIPFMVQMMLARNVEWDDCNPSGEKKVRKKKGEKKPAVTGRKYELTDETRTIGLGLEDHTVYRIRALRDIPRFGVKKGDLGGFVESEKNLSHKNDCWVGDEACIYEKARVKGNALVTEQACICGHARVCKMAKVAGHVSIDGKTCICGKTRMSAASLAGDAEISDERHIFLLGPVGPDDDYFVAYRAKEGNICIRKKLISFIHWCDECQSVPFREDYSFLSELARTQPGNWPDIEYGFMMQMMKSRIEEWKQGA